MSRRVLGPSMAIALSYIRSHPGCNIRQVDAACRTARKGHSWMYATVHRLIRSGFVRDTGEHRARYSLVAVE